MSGLPQDRRDTSWSTTVGLLAVAAGGLHVLIAWLAIVASSQLGGGAMPSITAATLVGWWSIDRGLIASATRRWMGAVLTALSAALHLVAAEQVLGLPSSIVVPHPVLAVSACAFTSIVLPRRRAGLGRRRRLFGPAALVVVLAFGAATPALGWISGARLAQPTPAQAASGGVDLTIDTHQWFADRALAVLAGDGHDNVTRFFDSIDPTAPGATSAEGARGPFTYRWRLLRGASDADGVLYRNVRDHFHNFWTHRGRQWVLGGSAASNAEKSYQRAVDLWSKGQRGEAVYWLGAAVHLLDDACVPQHEYFALNPYHHQYELWVQRHQDQLAVSSAGIYRGQFRADDGHGGDDWSSSHPRGWVDECAHRAVRILRAASHPNGAGDGSPNDPQWRTADHIAASQRLTAGFVMLFFDRVGAP